MSATKSVAKKSPLSYKKLFYYQGVSSEFHGDQFVGDCPFCNKDHHFYGNDITGQWDCKSCKLSGNYITFLRSILTRAVESTTDTLFNSLSDDRGIPVLLLKDASLAFNDLTDRWLFPQFDERDRLTNLYVYNPADGSMRGTSGCKQSLIGIHALSSRHKSHTLWLAEGHWDYLILCHLFGDAPETSILGLPGSSIKKEWYPTLKAFRRVHLLADADNAGITLSQKAAEILPHLSVLYWPEGTPEKYDIRDLYKLGAPFIEPASTSACIEFINTHLEEVEPQGQAAIEAAAPGGEISYLVDPLPCETFEELLTHFHHDYFVTEDMEQCLAAACAVYLSTNSTEEPLWLHIVGPPSSAKSRIIEAMKGTEGTYTTTSWTGLHSGFKDKDEETISPLDRINGKCVLIKDFTTILSQPKEMQTRIFGELRDCFDGSSKFIFRNNEISDFNNIRLTILTGSTEIIYRIDHTNIGERFLKIRISNEDGTAKVKSSSESFLANFKPTYHSEVSLDPSALKLRQHVAGFLLQKRQSVPHIIPRIDKRTLAKIQALAESCAWVQTSIDRPNGKVPNYKQSHNPGTRLVRLLTKLTIFLTHVLDQPAAAVYPIIRKVALDTVHNYQTEIAWSLVERPKYLRDIARGFGFSESSIIRKTGDLITLNVIERKAFTNGSGRGGAKVMKYTLTPPFARLVKKAGI